jgi:nitric oxide reductase subunit B
VVHIWVESIFEFFGAAVIAVLMVAMGLVSAKAALRVAYFTAALVFLSGILGTAHHYFWYGGSSMWLAIGAVFSSIEPVPLFGLVVRGLLEYKSIRAEGRDFPYRWPMYFLVASSFWNFLGAGVFGFLINLPIVNYFEHGTYLTVNLMKRGLPVLLVSAAFLLPSCHRPEPEHPWLQGMSFSVWSKWPHISGATTS